MGSPHGMAFPLIGCDTMKVSTTALVRLLKTTKRNQFVNGKEQPQVVSCILRSEGGTVQTTSIVRDGKTSVARFSITGDGFPATIPVPDIDRLLGALKFHGQNVTLDVTENKLVVKSGNKTTTMSANTDGRALPNIHTTIGEQEKNSQERAQSIEENKYVLQDGDKITPFFSYTMDAENLFDALRCDEMNGQRLNRYRFIGEEDDFKVVVGDHLKGQTEILLDNEKITPKKSFEATFEGGLEYVLKHYNGKVRLSFFDFTNIGQGYRLVLTFSNEDFLLQASVL